MHKEKVALLFFGLTRGLKYTLDKINSNIIDQIKSYSMQRHIRCLALKYLLYLD